MEIVSHPIRRIGEFFGRLPPFEQRNAKKLKYNAHWMPRMDIMREFHRLKRVSVMTNYAGG
jgi:hypothetical protein